MSVAIREREAEYFKFKEKVVELKDEEIERKLEELRKKLDIISESIRLIDESLEKILKKYNEIKVELMDLKYRDPEMYEKLNKIKIDAEEILFIPDKHMKKKRFNELIDYLRDLYNKVKEFGEILGAIKTIKEFIITIIMTILNIFGLL